ncbi:MAG: carbohydrate ABC transporter permease [Defluviitaleaceae bacterium]|nr:carbohydrate ABC transporter permease [Defluviitaleaceae bacterium]
MSIRLPRFSGSTVAVVILLTGIAFVFMLPVIYIISTAFKPMSELFLYPPRFLVQNPTTQNFTDFMQAAGASVVPFSRFLFNSVIVTVSSVIIALLFSSTCAYAFSKMDFPGKGWLFSLIIISLMFAPEAVIITRFLIISQLGIINTYFGHILPQVAVPVGVFLMKQFMDQIPASLSEAAKIEGATELDVYWRIILPNVMPAVGTVMIIVFQGVWGDTSTSVLFMTHESMRTLPYFVTTLTANMGFGVARQGAAAAAGLIMFLPNFIIFAIMQKSMIQTMVNSGIK